MRGTEHHAAQSNPRPQAERAAVPACARNPICSAWGTLRPALPPRFPTVQEDRCSVPQPISLQSHTPHPNPIADCLRCSNAPLRNGVCPHHRSVAPGTEGPQQSQACWQGHGHSRHGDPSVPKPGAVAWPAPSQPARRDCSSGGAGRDAPAAAGPTRSRHPLEYSILWGQASLGDQLPLRISILWDWHPLGSGIPWGSASFGDQHPLGMSYPSGLASYGDQHPLGPASPTPSPASREMLRGKFCPPTKTNPPPDKDYAAQRTRETPPTPSPPPPTFNRIQKNSTAPAALCKLCSKFTAAQGTTRTPVAMLPPPKSMSPSTPTGTQQVLGRRWGEHILLPPMPTLGAWSPPRIPL